jgi:amino acid transporter
VIHPALGFVAGWSMLMDYILNPLICTIWCSKAAMNIIPVPYPIWAIFFVALFTGMNLRKIHATARTNATLAIAMGIVIVAVLVACARYVLASPALSPSYFTRPFFNPATFSVSRLAAGTSIAVLTYIGFDGISTLSEEVQDPRRNILLATVLVCLIIGILSAIEVYAAQLVWPDGMAFPDLDTAYVHVAGRAGGAILFQLVNFTLLVASIGSGSGGQLAGARLLYGMGREGALPRPFFGAIDEKSHIPRNNVLLIGAFCLAGAFLFSYQFGAELLNFGAFVGFMGVNLSSFLHDYVRADRKAALNLYPPIAGFLICFALWLSLPTPAKIFGFVWLAVGVLYGIWKTRGFRDPVRFAP